MEDVPVGGGVLATATPVKNEATKTEEEWREHRVSTPGAIITRSMKCDHVERAAEIEAKDEAETKSRKPLWLRKAPVRFRKTPDNATGDHDRQRASSLDTSRLTEGLTARRAVIPAMEAILAGKSGQEVTSAAPTLNISKTGPGKGHWASEAADTAIARQGPATTCLPAEEKTAEKTRWRGSETEGSFWERAKQQDAQAPFDAEAWTTRMKKLQEGRSTKSNKESAQQL